MLFSCQVFRNDKKRRAGPDFFYLRPSLCSEIHFEHIDTKRVKYINSIHVVVYNRLILEPKGQIF